MILINGIPAVKEPGDTEVQGKFGKKQFSFIFKMRQNGVTKITF